ncbi:MAG TPA: hypothetical protein VND19_15265 [Acetobacteraceae bacterium]|nr:hypothetical protein [Acetobacteraceae bacterium]
MSVNRDKVAELAACGRARWKIENEPFKLAAVSRMATTESIVGLASELAVERRLLYIWRDHLQTGGSAALRRAGRGSRAGVEAIEASVAAADVTDPAEARRRIGELERKIGQQQLEPDFFARPCGMSGSNAPTRAVLARQHPRGDRAARQSWQSYRGRTHVRVGWRRPGGVLPALAGVEAA